MWHWKGYVATVKSETMKCWKGTDMLKGNRKGRNSDGSQTFCKHLTFLPPKLSLN